METLTQKQHEERGKIWNESLDCAKKGFLKEIPEWMYDDMLCNMPPLIQMGNGYMNSEPYSHNGEGKGIYFCGIETGGKFYGCYATVKQFKSREPLQRVKVFMN